MASLKKPLRVLIPLAAAIAITAWTPGERRTAQRSVVDLELALAVDTSASVDPMEYRLQMTGLVQAFHDPAVVAAIEGTGKDGIAVTLYHWSSSGEQEQIVPWARITDALSAADFANAIAANYERRFADSTGIGDAIKFGASLIRRNRFEGRRKSIDVSGDGRNNSGVPPDIVRDAVVAEGISVNGLAILNDEPYLHHYYARNVIGGPAAFVTTVASYDDIVRGMRIKLLREISISVASATPLTLPPDSDSEPVQYAKEYSTGERDCHQHEQDFECHAGDAGER